MPLPVGVSVAMMKRSNAPFASASFAHRSVVRRLPAVQTLKGDRRFRDHSLEVGVRHCGWSPLMWNDTCGCIFRR
jgi:hypothetical protein